MDSKEFSKEFKVAAVAQNPNEFGLRGHVVVAKDGEAWAFGARPVREKRRGSVIAVPLLAGQPAFWKLGLECVEPCTSAPSGIVDLVWQS